MEGALSSSPSSKSSSSVNSTPDHLCLIKGMSKEDLPHQRKPSGNPYPRRGQIKAGIFASFGKTVASLATTKEGGKEKEKGGGGQGSSASSTPPPRSYSSEGNSDG